jgi:hypothetical protein
MKQYLVAGLAAALITGGWLAQRPRPAPAACTEDGWPPAGATDPSRQRCVVFNSTYNGLPGSASNYGGLDHRCDVMGPDLHPWGAAFNAPPTHIDD